MNYGSSKTPKLIINYSLFSFTHFNFFLSRRLLHAEACGNNNEEEGNNGQNNNSSDESGIHWLFILYSASHNISNVVLINCLDFSIVSSGVKFTTLSKVKLGLE